jgi:hypothetical protein
MNDLYTFGCSYTNYAYPTYANYLAPYFKTHFNCGFPGSGNRAIFNKLALLLHKNQIKENDIVTIQWSALAREDKIIKNEWIGCGLITNSPLHDEEYIEKHFSPKQQAYELVSYISTILPLLKQKKIRVKWFYMLEPWFSEMLGEPGVVPDSLVDKYIDVFKSGVIDELKSLSVDDDYIGSIEGFTMDTGYLNFRNKLSYYVEGTEVHGDDHPNQYVHYLFSKKILDSFQIQPNEHDEFLYQNSLDWTNYITNDKLLLEVEKPHMETYNRKIQYFLNEYPNLLWPSTNTVLNIEKKFIK